MASFFRDLLQKLALPFQIVLFLGLLVLQALGTNTQASRVIGIKDTRFTLDVKPFIKDINKRFFYIIKIKLINNEDQCACAPATMCYSSLYEL